MAEIGIMIEGQEDMTWRHWFTCLMKFYPISTQDRRAFRSRGNSIKKLEEVGRLTTFT